MANDDRQTLDAGPALSVIIPVFNEQATLKEVVDRVARLACSKEILIVDDGSTDGTAERVGQFAQQAGVRVLFHERNLGKGAAIRTALRHAIGDVIVIQDADLEYDPAEIARLVAPIVDGRADVVYGSRFAEGSRSSSGLMHRTANRLLTWLSNRFTGLRLSDMETCYKAMRRDAAANLELRENRFGFEPEITAKLARRGWRIVEMPVSYCARGRSAGKKIGFRDGLRAVWCIVRYAWRD